MMTPAIAALHQAIAEDLQQVCRIFDDELFSDLPLINQLCEHMRGYRGKMLRPTLLLWCAKGCSRVTEAHLTLSAVIEMVHMATLVHDDVLDEADMRRRKPTINRLQGNEAAVLLGDYLISHAFHLCSSVDSFACRKIGAATNTVCEGELQQVHHRGDVQLSEGQYIEIVTRKTAALTATACFLGAHYAGSSAAVAEALERYGTHVGIAFQITDDVLDITGSQVSMGKTLGRDVEEGKLTLPVIHALREAGPAVRRELIDLITAPSPDRSALSAILRSTGSLDRAIATAGEHVDTAIAQLNCLPDNQARTTLTRLAGMILTREL